VFLEKWFNESFIDSKQRSKASELIKSFFTDEIFSNIDNYDFTDIIMYFTNHLIPKKNFTDTIDCSDSDIESWDETQAEYYETLPIKYYHYNKNNINIELKCTLDEIISSNVRKIKIKRKINNVNVCTSFYFYCNNPFIVFNQGGDMDINNGNLIISLILPNNYIWDNNNIIYNHDINLYEFMYGVNLKLNLLNKLYDIKQWLPYRDGTIINLMTVSDYMFKIKLNILYDSMDTNHHTIMETYFRQPIGLR